MLRVTLDVEAGQVSEELARRGIAASAQVHVLVEVSEDENDGWLSMAAVAQASGPGLPPWQFSNRSGQGCFPRWH